jgi:hypothetical protein
MQEKVSILQEASCLDASSEDLCASNEKEETIVVAMVATQDKLPILRGSSWLYHQSKPMASSNSG